MTTATLCSSLDAALPAATVTMVEGAAVAEGEDLALVRLAAAGASIAVGYRTGATRATGSGTSCTHQVQIHYCPLADPPLGGGTHSSTWPGR